MTYSKQDYALLRELGRRDLEDGTQLHVPAEPVARVAWAAPFNDERLDRAVAEARAAGATWAEVADAIGSATESAVAAQYGPRG